MLRDLSGLMHLVSFNGKLFGMVFGIYPSRFWLGVRVEGFSRNDFAVAEVTDDLHPNRTKMNTKQERHLNFCDLNDEKQ